MDFSTLAQSIWNQVVTVWNAPVPFVAVALALWFAMRAFYRAHFSNQLANKDERIRLRDDEIADYKRKLSGATPDQAAATIAAAEAKIARLEAAVENLQPRQRTLGDVVGQALLKELGDWPKVGPWQVWSKLGDPEAYAFAKEVHKHMKREGFKVHETIGTPMFTSPFEGYQIGPMKDGHGQATNLNLVAIGERPEG